MPSRTRAVSTGAPDTARWLLRGKDGRLTAYARAEGGLLRWTESAPGGPDWTGPDFFEAPGLTYLTLAQGADGYVHFVGRGERREADGKVVVDLVHSIQYQTGRPLMDWRPIGNPHTKLVERAPHLGAPAAAVDAQGTVHVFVRDAVNSVRMRREGKGGKWEGWKDFKVREALDGITALATSTGRVEVLAPGAKATLRWTQEKQGGELTRADDIPLAPVPGSGTLLETAPDRLTYYAADALGSGILAHRPADGGSAIPLGGAPGTGPVAALRTAIDGYDCTVLAHRTSTGRPALAAFPTEDEDAGLWWAGTGEPCLGAPALALDARGRVVMAAIGLDGTLRLARQKAEPGLALEAWTTV
ncbi:hypothetical protein DMA15_28890 [Streptomyces sp. WAC 01529]|uniref:hypothetical protein n=1 Tax=Streptomyces sp. WAC 01529 TaxID=2203205 RepID=UPI000F70059F|nr:hypothetical protein [Streptomyces sp. WAC 01529]AZM56114.1 hypothetical protein DMA15_28890 [Streptomyces sp. WAC 01529]